MRIHSSKKEFKCKYCAKSFTFKSALDRHTKKHPDELRFACRCGRRFIAAKKLNTHEKKCKARQYECFACKQNMQSKTYLKLHMKRMHRGKLPFQCRFCSKGFQQDCDLRQHLQAHEDNKQFQCNICEKAFTTNKNLKRHLMMHDNETYACDHCAKTFKTKRYLTKHLKRIHENMK